MSVRVLFQMKWVVLLDAVSVRRWFDVVIGVTVVVVGKEGVHLILHRRDKGVVETTKLTVSEKVSPSEERAVVSKLFLLWRFIDVGRVDGRI